MDAVAVAGDATASIPGSQSLIIGALELLFKIGCWAGGSTSIENENTLKKLVLVDEFAVTIFRLPSLN